MGGSKMKTIVCQICEALIEVEPYLIYFAREAMFVAECPVCKGYGYQRYADEPWEVSK